MIAETTFAVVGLLFLFADLRALLSTIYHSLFLGLGLPNAIVGGVALGAFGTSLLALAFTGLGPRRAVSLTAALLGGTTVLLAATRAQWGDLALGIVAVAAGLCWLALLAASRVPGGGSPLPAALPLALTVDFAIRSASTVSVLDLALPASLAIVVAAAFLLLAAGLTALGAEREWTRPSWRAAVGLLALPSLLLVADTGGLNAAQAALAAGFGLGPEEPGVLERSAVVLGAAIALGLVLLSRPRTPRRTAAFLAVMLGAAALWARVPGLSLAGGAVLALGCILASSLLVHDDREPADWPARTVLALGVGWLAMGAAAFALYALYDYLPAIAVATAFVSLASIVARGAPRILPRAVTFALAAAVVLVPLAALFTVPAVPAGASPATFRLLTWNVNQGFDSDQVADLDAVVDTIARESPDVVVLQEVTRGWVINERHDLLSVVAERLGMRYVFGPQIGDLYGNAILTRLSLEGTERIRFPKEPGLRYQPRGALIAKVAGVLLAATHLDHNRDASRVREAQVREILAAVGDRRPALIVGDLNALPESAELVPLARAGFADLAAAAGAREPTFPAEYPAERIDYVWGAGVTGAQVHVAATRASDHRPLVMNVAVGGR